MSDIAIRVENLSKVYRIGVNEQRHETLFGSIAAFARSPLTNFRNLRKLSRFRSFDEKDVLWALKDISFEVKHGEVLGMIGRNGAGKSTLLKILARITEPTSGRAEVFGRVGSLLEVGTGFHPDLTGRENVYLNGTILGMKKREIDRKFDAIVDFSGVERFIDTPVKRYSSGMRVRLAFSVAAHLEPEILIVDEVLAVGDMEFQKKCLGKMDEVAREGRTVMFVSHSMASITSLCSRGVQLANGQVVDDGPAADVVQRYITSNTRRTGQSLLERQDRSGSREALFCNVRFLLGNGTETDTLVSGEDGIIEAGYEFREPGVNSRKVSVSIVVSTPDGQNICCFWNQLKGELFKNLPDRGAVRCRIPRLPLMPGRYKLRLTMTNNGRLADKLHDAADLVVTEGDYFGTGTLPPAHLGVVLCEHSWSSDSTGVTIRPD